MVRLPIRYYNRAIESQFLETRKPIESPRSRVQLRLSPRREKRANTTGQLAERITGLLLYNERPDEAHSCSDREVDRRNHSCCRASGGFLFHCVSSLLSRLE